MEVTSRCNLGCPVCFASAGTPSKEPDIAMIGSWFDAMMNSGGPFNIQLSGGEPTMRDDLDEIIRLGRGRIFILPAEYQWDPDRRGTGLHQAPCRCGSELRIFTV